MRFLLAVIDSRSNSASGDEMAAIDAFNDKLRAGDHWIFAWGLTDPAEATVIDNRAGLGEVVPGPLHQLDEYMSGFWLINASSKDEAMALALEGSKACNRKVEVRQLH